MAYSLQYKWDVYLLTQFFNLSNKPMIAHTTEFAKKNKVRFEDVISLKRCTYAWNCKFDAYSFVAQYLRGLYKKIEKKGIEDVFDIAAALQDSTVETSRNPPKYLYRQLRKNKDENRLYSKAKFEKVYINELYEKSSAKNWSACK